MFRLIKKVLLIVLISSVNAIPCILIINQECKGRKVVVNNKYMTYPYSIKVSRCNGSCNNISNSYSRVHIPDIVKNVTLKNLI